MPALTCADVGAVLGGNRSGTIACAALAVSVSLAAFNSDITKSGIFDLGLGGCLESCLNMIPASRIKR